MGGQQKGTQHVPYPHRSRQMRRLVHQVRLRYRRLVRVHGDDDCLAAALANGRWRR